MPTFFQAEQYYQRAEYAAAKEVIESLLRETPNDRRALAMLNSLTTVDTQLAVTDQAATPSAATHADWQWVEDARDAEKEHPTFEIMRGMALTYGLALLGILILIGLIAWASSMMPLVLSIRIPLPSTYAMPSGGGSIALSELSDTSTAMFGSFIPCMGFMFALVIAARLFGAIKHS